MTSSNATTADRYIEMWNETDPARRRELAASTVSEDAEYLDPIMSGRGVDGITAMIGGRSGPVSRPSIHPGVWP